MARKSRKTAKKAAPKAKKAKVSAKVAAQRRKAMARVQAEFQRRMIELVTAERPKVYLSLPKAKKATVRKQAVKAGR